MKGRQLAGRSVAVGTIGALSLALGGIGVATAANGGSLLLGHTNSESSTTTIKNTNGTPLSLVGKTSKPPLKVNSSKQVAGLNASLLGGHSAAALGAGSAGKLPYPHTVTLPAYGGTSVPGAAVAQTHNLKSGTYYVTAMATGISGTEGIACDLTVNGTGVTDEYGLTGNTAGTATETEAFTVHHGQKIVESCSDDGSSTTDDVLSAGIVAIRVASSSTGITVAARHMSGDTLRRAHAVGIR